MNRSERHRRVDPLLLTVAILFSVVAMATTLQAATVVTGNVTPPLPWGNGTDARIGNTGSGTLVLDASSQLLSGSAFLGYYSGATGTATISGAASKWTNSSSLYVGQFGSGTLLVEAGGQVISSSGYLGYRAGSTGTATITGPGSQWTNTARDFVVGSYGGGTLRAQAGGLVSSKSGTLGDNTSSTGTATITGSGSMWNNSGSLHVGRFGSGTLLVEAGGLVSNPSGYLGSYAGSTGTATITGPGSKWTNTSDLTIGHYGRGTLLVEAGGQVISSSGCLGNWSGSTGTATITGPGSMWTNSYLDVGRNGSGTLQVEDGGQVTAGTLYASPADLFGDGTITATKGAVLDADLRFDASHGTHKVFSFGSGGTLTVDFAADGNLGVGHKRTGTLAIADGVVVSSSSGTLGFSTGSTGTATITGPGSQWNNTYDLYVGDYGRGTLLVEAGGQVSSRRSGTLGNSTGSTGTATITGPGSQWNITYALYVGRNGSGTLQVEDGAQVTAGTLYASLGDLHGDGMITATKGAVLDANLRFDASNGTHQEISFGSGGTLTVDFTAGGVLGAGHKGTGSLTIAEGVAVASYDGYLGYWTGSGTATITGHGSQWNSDGLSVGYNGSGTLTVEAGGRVSSGSGTLGANAGSEGMATITGPGSMWTNTNYLDVGFSGSGTLLITGGGLVSVADTLTIDNFSAGDSFINMSTGGMLALKGDADDTVLQFLGLVSGTDAIRYWDDTLVAHPT